MDLFELLKTLNASHGPSGDEEGIRSVIANIAAPFADEITTDVMGNLIVHKKGAGPKVMFAAHMDSIGFIVTHIEKEGYLRVGPLGGITAAEVCNTPVRFRSGLRGTLVREESAEMGKLKLDKCYLDIGAEDEAQAKKSVSVGDTVVYDTPVFRSGGNVVSPYLDNRISCVVLLAALEMLENSGNDLYFVFTTQEEVGLRGARTAAWSIAPDYAIAVDVTDVDDTPGSEHYGTAKLGKGAAIKVMDSSVICHTQVVSKLDELGKQNQIPVQKDILRAGGTDAGAIHVSRTGVLTGGISVPCRYIHTPVETANMNDVDSCARLVAAFAQAALEKP